MNGPVILIGFKGCGKSTVGRLLADKLEVEFIDIDNLVEKLHHERTKQELDFRGIYTEHGPEYFEALELEAVRSAFSKHERVVSFGGGALMNADAANVEMDKATFVYITVEPEVLFERIMKNGIPAFFDSNNPRGSFEKIMSGRTPVYEKYANVTVDNTASTPEMVAEIIRTELLTHGEL